MSSTEGQDSRHQLYLLRRLTLTNLRLGLAGGVARLVTLIVDATIRVASPDPLRRTRKGTRKAVRSARRDPPVRLAYSPAPQPCDQREPDGQQRRASKPQRDVRAGGRVLLRHTLERRGHPCKEVRQVRISLPPKLHSPGRGRTGAIYPVAVEDTGPVRPSAASTCRTNPRTRSAGSARRGDDGRPLRQDAPRVP